MPNSDDSALIRECQTGDRTALNRLFQIYEGKVYGLCYRITGHREDALDLSQEVLIRAMRGLPSFDSSRPFFPWLKKIAVNTCLNHLRRNDKLFLCTEGDIEAAAREGQSVYQAVEDAELRDTVQKCLNSLPPAMRVLMVLRHYESLSYQEMADTTGLPLGTVKTNLHRARDIMKRKLAGTGREVL